MADDLFPEEVICNDDAVDGYEVGYKKPPKHRQFQKGVSGNPKGRPRKPLDSDHELIRESEALMPIKENGRPKRVSKHNIALKQLLKLAMTGNILALRLYLKHRQEAVERLALIAGTQPNNSKKYDDVENFTDEELTAMLRKYEKEDNKVRKRNKSNTE